MDDLIEKVIIAAVEPDSPNKLSLAQVKNWLREYLDLYEDELSRFPELRGRPHGDILIADFDASRDAFFAAAVFQEKDFRMVCGRANADEIRDFTDRKFPEDASQLISALSEKFLTFTDREIEVVQEQVKYWLRA